MRLYLAIPFVLVALLFAVSGVAALTRGWVLSWNRRQVRRVRLYGWGQLVVAFGLCWQVVFGLVISGPYVREWGYRSGMALMVIGFVVMAMGRREGGNRQGAGMP
ncbi:hypothetical protein ACFVAF_00475 [Streptomyces sp. NPDC057596]|uniref:hypothetical protein n=1 Tax=Streptomyces sp. NPDC057596 TaxID=3346178 RepID=UPI00367DD490